MENIKKESLFPWVFLNNYYEVDEFIPYYIMENNGR